MKGGSWLERGIEGERKAAGGIVVAGERFGDGGAALFAGIPGFENGVGVLLGPVDGEGAAVLQDDDQRLAGGGDSLREVPPARRADRWLVRSPPLKPSSLTGISSPSSEGERPTKAMMTSDCFAACDGLVAQDGRGRVPGEVDAGAAGAVEVFEADGVGLGVGEVDGCFESPRRVRRCLWRRFRRPALSSR